MSRPKAWNGSAWVDPAFHVGGGVYKSYIPPLYDVAHGAWSFDANAQGWEWTPAMEDAGPASWTGGLIWGRTPGAGLFDFGTMQGPYVPPPSGGLEPSALSIGIKLRCRVILDNGPGSGPGTSLTVPAFNPSNSSKYIRGIGDNVWTDVTTHQLGLPSDFIFGSKRATISFGIEQGYTEGHFRVEIDYCHFWNLTANKQLMALGNPGWEPKIKRADGTWK